MARTLDFNRAFLALDIKPKDWVITKVVPSFFGGLLIAYLALVSGLFGTYYLLAYPLPLLTAGLAGFRPIWKAESYGIQINQNMHLFISRMGILAISDVGRMGLFNVVAQKTEYRALGEEVDKIFRLIKFWGISLSEAARQIATRTPSSMFADFLERMAYALEGGVETEIFFLNEQAVVMDQFEIEYMGSLNTMEVMKEIFISIVTAAVFIIVIVSIFPLLTGQEAILQLVMGVVIFISSEIFFLWFFVAVVPPEKVWHQTQIQTRTDDKINRVLMTALAMTVSMAVYFYYTKTILVTMEVTFSLIVTPLIVPGYVVGVEEAKIKRRDENYPAFLRSLAGSASTRGIGSTAVLKKLRMHNFGPLTQSIDDLYKRLSTGINAVRAWRYFGAETGSDLIQKFSEMYVEGTKEGGHPQEISVVISNNFIRMLGLRRRRYQEASTLTGLLYGIAVAITLPLYIILFIVQSINDIFSKVVVPEGYTSSAFANPGAFNITWLNIIIFSMIVGHAFLSSLMTRLVGGGNKIGGFLHFVLLMWISTMMALFVKFSVAGII